MKLLKKDGYMEKVKMKTNLERLRTILVTHPQCCRRGPEEHSDKIFDAKRSSLEKLMLMVIPNKKSI